MSPISSRAARDLVWEQLLMLASWPLRKFGSDNRVCGSASCCIVEYRLRRFVFTAAHATEDQGIWAIELDYVPPNGIKTHRVGTLHFLAETIFSDRVVEAMRGDRELNFSRDWIREDNQDSEIDGRLIDFAYVDIRDNLRGFYFIASRGQIISKMPRLELRSTLDVNPIIGNQYGFSGQVEIGALEHSQEIHGEIQLETGLWYAGMEEGYDVFDLDHVHPGDIKYKGCSGAPVLGVDGELVGLVVGAAPDGKRVRALPLREYRKALDVLIDQGKCGLPL